MRKLFAMAVAAAVVTALLPAAAEAKTRRVSTSVDLDVFGIIDRHGAVKYAWGAEVGAGLTFSCSEDRHVTLFHVEPNGSATAVASAVTDFGFVFGDELERPLSQITGYYYAEAAPSTKRFTRRGKHHKVRCLAGRSPTIFVEVPAGLL